MPDPLQLSRRERQIMEAVYAAGELTAAQVVAALPDPPTLTTIRTFLGILERKGHLTHAKRGREFVYQPTRPPGQVARSALRRVLATFFAGSLERAVSAYLSDPRGALSDEELARLRDSVARARAKGKRS